MTERAIRAAIVLALAELYSDPLSRSQYKRFTFGAADQAAAERVLRQLERHLLIERRDPGVVRMTDVGYRLLEPEFGQLRYIRDTGEHAVSRDGGEPAPNVVDQISREVGGADFVSATRLIDGRFVTFWATRGFAAVTGYTPAELEAAGGWPVILHGVPADELRRLFERIVYGERVKGEMTFVHRSGRRVRLAYASWPRLDDAGTRVIGTLTAARRLRESR